MIVRIHGTRHRFSGESEPCFECDSAEVITDLQYNSSAIITQDDKNLNVEWTNKSVDTISLKDDFNGRETLGAHLRNMLTPYKTLISMIEDLQSNEDKKKFILDYITKMDMKDFERNIDDILKITEMPEVEFINWRNTDLYRLMNE